MEDRRRTGAGPPRSRDRHGPPRRRDGPPRDRGPRGGLHDLLAHIDGAPYGAYRRLLGTHRLGEFVLIVDRVPPDPFAGAARIRLTIERAKSGLPDSLVDTAVRRTAVEDCVVWQASSALARVSRSVLQSAPGSGRVFLEPAGPAMLERSGCRIGESAIELRLFVDLPASGRRVRGLQTESLFSTTLAQLATSTLVFSSRRVEEARHWADLAEDHVAAQEALRRRGLVAFVADGSLLARASGDDPGPRRDGREVPFVSPRELSVTLELPRGGSISGMGIPGGITLVVGGAFHGKSTLLDAIASAVHPHRPGDGRERVATIPDAVVVRSEDGRSVRRVDISGFLGELPSGDRPSDFSTEKASGSTSQAAAIAEALEVGTSLVLMDEDTCATNLMIRDGRMQRLLPRPSEPIIPLIDRLREMYERFGVSSIVATGGSGDYLEIADVVILMNGYRAEDATSRAREVAAATRSMRLHEEVPPMGAPVPREPYVDLDAAPRSLRTALRGPRGIRIGDETVSLAAVEQIVETGQVRAIALLLREAAARMTAHKDLGTLVRELDAWIGEAGVDALDPPAAYDLTRPRPHEIAAALNRWRGLRARRSEGGSSPGA